MVEGLLRSSAANAAASFPSSSSNTGPAHCTSTYTARVCRATTMSRRQNSSCDQCRKGKRACDAVWLRDRQIQRTLEASGLKGSPGLLSHGGTFPNPPHPS